MPTRKVSYQCNVCECEYTSKDFAVQCEECHKIDEVKYLYRKDGQAQPEGIVISMGSKEFRYFRRQS